MTKKRNGGEGMKALASAIFLLWSIGIAAAQDKVVLGGSGSMTDGMIELAKAYMVKHPSESVQVIVEAMGNT
jgi:hypothetical protein